jgi:hypothetical protein
MESPGLSLENNVLTIRGEKQQELDENNERVHRSERVYGVFERTFVLPNTVDADRIEARRRLRQHELALEPSVLIRIYPPGERGL